MSQASWSLPPVPPAVARWHGRSHAPGHRRVPKSPTFLSRWTRCGTTWSMPARTSACSVQSAASRPGSPAPVTHAVTSWISPRCGAWRPAGTADALTAPTSARTPRSPPTISVPPACTGPSGDSATDDPTAGPTPPKETPMSQRDYAISYQPLFGTLQSIDVQALIDQVDDPWYNQTLIQVGDVLVRLGVMEGEFHWHKHDQQDEFFFVLDGLFRIELDGADTVELGPRQAFTVPAGMLHRPVVPARSAVLMIEKAGVIATGD